jgi:hypothetical protein
MGMHYTETYLSQQPIPAIHVHAGMRWILERGVEGIRWGLGVRYHLLPA